MADPILIDDGGSTRIKQIKITPGTTGKMDELLDNKEAPAVGGFTQVQIVYIDATGAPQGPFSWPLTGRDIVIFSENNQTVNLKIRPIPHQADYSCGVVVSKSAIVESRATQGQRRYIVANAGPINIVMMGAGGPPGPPLFDATATPSLYTMVHLT